MKSETEKILEKHIKTCTDCGKEFLGIAINGGVNPAHTWQAVSEISLYPLKCGKCPSCAEKCSNKHREYTKDKEPSEKIKQLKCPEDIFADSGMLYEDWYGLVPCYFYFNIDYSPDLHDVDETGATYLFDLLEFFKEKENNK